MADVIDNASATQALIEEHQLNAARKQAGKLDAVATGHCLNCDEELSNGRRWCDAGCRDDWEKLNKR